MENSNRNDSGIFRNYWNCVILSLPKNTFIIKLLIILRNFFLLISSMFSGLLGQLQIFWQLFLTQLVKLFTGLGLLELFYLIYPRLLQDLSLSSKSSLMELLIRLSAVFRLITAVDGFMWFWSRPRKIRHPIESRCLSEMHFCYCWEIIKKDEHRK